MEYVELHKIICSKECAKKLQEKCEVEKQLEQLVEGLHRKLQERDEMILQITEEKGDQIRDLQEEISRLLGEHAEKDKYISKQRRDTQDFRDEAVAAEQHYEDEMKRQKGIVTDLNKEIIMVIERNNVMSEEVSKMEIKINELENLISGLRETNQEMLTTIQTLTHENECNIETIKSTKYELFLLQQEKKSDSTDLEANNVEVDTEMEEGRQHGGVLVGEPESDKSTDRAECVAGEISKRGRLLLLCDQMGYGLGKILRSKLNGYLVQVIIKPYACYSGVVESVRQLTAEFTKDDTVVVLAGTNDFRNGKYPSFKELNDSIKHCTHTNIMLVAVPFISGEARLNRYIHKFNVGLLGYTQKLDHFAEACVSFLDVNGGSAGLMLKKHEIVAKMVKMLKSGRNFAVKNLTFISTVSDSESEKTEIQLVADSGEVNAGTSTDQAGSDFFRE